MKKWCFLTAMFSFLCVLWVACSLEVNGDLKSAIEEDISSTYIFYEDNPATNGNVQSLTVRYKIGTRKAVNDFPVFRRQGYHIAGWQYYNNPDTLTETEPTAAIVTDEAGYITALTVTPQSASLYAVWEEGDPDGTYYTVTFVVDGQIVAAQSVREGERVQYPDIDGQRENYDLRGWFTDDLYENWFEWDTPIYGNITLYGYWVEVRYITYHRNDGTTVEDQNHWQTERYSVEYNGAAYTAFGDTMFGEHTDGFYFLKWNTKADGTGTDYDAGDLIEKNFTESIDLYAVWTTECYTVTLVNSADRNQKLEKRVGKEAGKSAKVSLNNIYWQNQESFVAPYGYQCAYALATADEVDTITEVTETQRSRFYDVQELSADTTYYVLWHIQVIGHLYWDEEQASESLTYDSYLYPQPITEPDYTPWRDHYTFDGWYMDSGTTMQAYFGALSGADADQDGYIHVYAKWLSGKHLYVDEQGDDSTGDGTTSAPYKTLSRALQDVWSSDDDYTIHISGTIEESGTVSIASDVQSITLAGTTSANKDKVTLASGVSGSVLSVQTSTSITLANLTITGGKAMGGGGLYLDGQANVTIAGGTVISENTAGAYPGGGIYNKGTLTIAGGTIRGNSAGDGGGIYNAGTLTIAGGTITGNTAANAGGVYNRGGFTMSGGTISANTVTDTGSGVYQQTDAGSSFTMSGTATIASGNDVYLPSGKTITVAGSLGAQSPVATITPEAYADATQVLSGAAVSTEYSKFAVTPQSDETRWTITSEGKLKQVEAELSVTVTISGTSSVEMPITITKDAAAKTVTFTLVDTTEDHWWMHYNNCTFDGETIPWDGNSGAQFANLHVIIYTGTLAKGVYDLVIEAEHTKASENVTCSYFAQVKVE